MEEGRGDVRVEDKDKDKIVEGDGKERGEDAQIRPGPSVNSLSLQRKMAGGGGSSVAAAAVAAADEGDSNIPRGSDGKASGVGAQKSTVAKRKTEEFDSKKAE